MILKNKALRFLWRLLVTFVWVSCAGLIFTAVHDKMEAVWMLLGITIFLFVTDKKLCGPERSAEGEPEGRFWLQHADGPCDTIKDETADGIIAAVKAFPWEAELEKMALLKKKAVPPGLGLGNYGDPHFVHITAKTAATCDVLYVRGDQKADDQVYKEDLPFGITGKIVTAYLAADEKKLLELLA